MPVKLCVSILCCLSFLGNACESKTGANQSSAPTSTPASVTTSSAGPASSPSEAKPAEKSIPGADSNTTGIPALDACGLIEKSEIESVQGAKVQGTVPSKRDDGALAIAQCYYTIFSADGSKNLSMHMEVTQSDPKGANPNAVVDLWREKFQGAKGSKKMEAPKPVAGVGDGAYWVGNNKSGALYVLKKNKLIRISLGGPDNEEVKIQKSRTLAEKALKRLS